jgi:YbgC/YbaW family acyl-CoA thioester hydrolase
MHRTPIHVRWGELDPYHHVNHATYLTYLEHARISALDSIGWGMDELRHRGYQVVVVEIEVRFRAPATAGDELVVETWLQELRGASSRWGQRVMRGGEVVLEASVRAATTTLDGHPVRTPEAFRSALAALTPA